MWYVRPQKRLVEGLPIQRLVEQGRGKAVGINVSSATQVLGLDGEMDCRAIFAVDDDIGKRGDTGDFDADRRKETPRYGYRLDSLVDGPGANRLHFDGHPVLHHAGYGAGNRCRRRFGGNLEALRAGVLFAPDIVYYTHFREKCKRGD